MNKNNTIKIYLLSKNNKVSLLFKDFFKFYKTLRINDKLKKVEFRSFKNLKNMLDESNINNNKFNYFIINYPSIKAETLKQVIDLSNKNKNKIFMHTLSPRFSFNNDDIINDESNSHLIQISTSNYINSFFKFLFFIQELELIGKLDNTKYYCEDEIFTRSKKMLDFINSMNKSIQEHKNIICVTNEQESDNIIKITEKLVIKNTNIKSYDLKIINLLDLKYYNKEEFPILLKNKYLIFKNLEKIEREGNEKILELAGTILAHIGKESSLKSYQQFLIIVDRNYVKENGYGLFFSAIKKTLYKIKKIHLPDLNDRKEDIFLLAQHILVQLSYFNNKIVQLHPDCLETLRNNNWIHYKTELEFLMKHIFYCAKKQMLIRNIILKEYMKQTENILKNNESKVYKELFFNRNLVDKYKKFNLYKKTENYEKAIKIIIEIKSVIERLDSNKNYKQKKVLIIEHPLKDSAKSILYSLNLDLKSTEEIQETVEKFDDLRKVIEDRIDSEKLKSSDIKKHIDKGVKKVLTESKKDHIKTRNEQKKVMQKHDRTESQRHEETQEIIKQSEINTEIEKKEIKKQKKIIIDFYRDEIIINGIPLKEKKYLNDFRLVEYILLHKRATFIDCFFILPNLRHKKIKKGIWDTISNRISGLNKYFKLKYNSILIESNTKQYELYKHKEIKSNVLIDENIIQKEIDEQLNEHYKLSKKIENKILNTIPSIFVKLFKYLTEHTMINNIKENFSEEFINDAYIYLLQIEICYIHALNIFKYQKKDNNTKDKKLWNETSKEIIKQEIDIKKIYYMKTVIPLCEKVLKYKRTIINNITEEELFLNIIIKVWVKLKIQMSDDINSGMENYDLFFEELKNINVVNKVIKKAIKKISKFSSLKRYSEIENKIEKEKSIGIFFIQYLSTINMERFKSLTLKELENKEFKYAPDRILAILIMLKYEIDETDLREIRELNRAENNLTQDKENSEHCNNEILLKIKEKNKYYKNWDLSRLENVIIKRNMIAEKDFDLIKTIDNIPDSFISNSNIKYIL